MPAPHSFISAIRPARFTVRACTTAVLLAATTLAACNDDDDATGPSGPVLVAQDPAGDFLATYTGPRNADLDVRRAEVVYNGTTFVFTSTSAGAIGTTPAPVGTTPGALFVWGVDRGAGIARFGDLATGVHFDLVVIAQPDGVGRVTDLTTTPATTTTLPTGSVAITGRDLRITVPATLLPTRGFTPARYTANLWPRVGGGNNNQISDFAPDNSNLQVRSMQ